MPHRRLPHLPLARSDVTGEVVPRTAAGPREGGKKERKKVLERQRMGTLCAWRSGGGIPSPPRAPAAPPAPGNPGAQRSGAGKIKTFKPKKQTPVGVRSPARSQGRGTRPGEQPGRPGASRAKFLVPGSGKTPAGAAAPVAAWQGESGPGAAFGCKNTISRSALDGFKGGRPALPPARSSALGTCRVSRFRNRGEKGKIN